MKTERIVVVAILAATVVGVGVVMMSQAYGRRVHYPCVIPVRPDSEVWLESTGDRVSKLVFEWQANALWLNGSRIMPPTGAPPPLTPEESVPNWVKDAPITVRKYAELGSWAASERWYIEKVIEFRQWARARKAEVDAGTLSRDECVRSIAEHMHTPPYHEILDLQRGVECTPAGFTMYNVIDGSTSGGSPYYWGDRADDRCWMRGGDSAGRVKADQFVRMVAARLQQMAPRGGTHFIGDGGLFQSFADSSAVAIRGYISQLVQTGIPRESTPLAGEFARSIVRHSRDSAASGS